MATEVDDEDSAGLMVTGPCPPQGYWPDCRRSPAAITNDLGRSPDTSTGHDSGTCERGRPRG